MKMKGQFVWITFPLNFAEWIAFSRNATALRAASFHRFNCVFILPISLDKAEDITQNSALISFLPETFNIVRNEEIQTYTLQI